MSDKSFQQMVDEAFEKAINRYGEHLERLIQNRERMLTISDISRLTGFSTMAVRNWIRREENPLPAFQVDKEYRVLPQVFWRWFEQFGTWRKERVGKLINLKLEKKNG